MSTMTTSKERLPQKVRILLFGNMLSAVGNGLVYPYFFIYLHNVRGIPSALAGVVIGYGAFASLLISPIVGSLIDHWGPKPILMGSLILSGIGYASISTIHNIVQAILVITICSFGQSAMWPSQSAIQAELTPEHQRQRAYGSNFAMLNLGIGAGGLIASVVVSVSNPHSFEVLYWCDGLSFFVYAAIAYSIGNVGQRNEHERAINSARDSGWKEVLADKVYVRFWITCLFAIICGYSQLEVGFASFSSLIAHVPVPKIAYAYAVNCILIATCQLWVVKRTEKWNRSKAIALATTIWLFAWVALSLAGVDRHHALFFIILCQAIFGFAEMVWSPVVPSVVNQLAPDHLRGRYNSASSNAWQFSLIIGPMIAGTLLGAGLQWIWIGGLVIGLAIVTVFALRMKLPDRHEVKP
jgi:MFS family permease